MMTAKPIEYRRDYHTDREVVVCRERPMEYPWHFHLRHWTFGVVRSGSVSVATMDGCFTLRQGQSFIIAPLAPHMISLSGHSVLAVLCSPSPIMQAKLFDQDKPRHCSELFDDWESCPPVAPGKPALFAAAPVPDASPPVARVRNLLESRPGECFPLEALAERAGYSPWHFARLFKRETGFAPHAFQLVCRLSLARDMLRKGTAAVETAVSTGFSDQSHLHKFFKLHHGLTPKQFVMACVAL